jgi:hypothetical protein
MSARGALAAAVADHVDTHLMRAKVPHRAGGVVPAPRRLVMRIDV